MKILGILVMALLFQSTMVTCLAEQQPPPKIPVRVKGPTASGDVRLKIYPDGWIKVSGHISTFSKPAEKLQQPSPITPPTSVDMSRSRRIGS